MENFKNYTELTISRIDYLKSIYASLPKLSNINDIVDINEVKEISFIFENEDDALSLHSSFPKSYNAKTGSVCGYRNEKGESILKYYVSFYFNTFCMNESTGSANETAFKRRIKVIEKLKEIL